MHCSYRFYFHVKVTYVIFTAAFSLLSTLVNCHHGLFLNPFSKMHLTLSPSPATKAGNRAYNTALSQKHAHTFNSLTQLYVNNVKRIQTWSRSRVWFSSLKNISVFIVSEIGALFSLRLITEYTGCSKNRMVLEPWCTGSLHPLCLEIVLLFFRWENLAPQHSIFVRIFFC